MKTVCVIDGDVLAYRAAAANEERSIKAVHNGSGEALEYKHRTAFKEAGHSTEDFTIEDVQRPDEIAFALHSMKVTIKTLCDVCETEDYEIFLSGESNFREDLPLPTRYKSSREGLQRPVQLAECRDYLIKHHNAVRAVGCEADDMLAHRAYEGLKSNTRLIQSTIDKDANGVEGWLYNWLKMPKPILVKGLGSLTLEKGKLSGLGRKWLFAQWVLGDITDCYKPSEIAGVKFGDAGVFKLLGNCKTDQECVQAVYNKFKEWYPDVVEYVDWTGKEQRTDVIGIMQMYADCCFMRRFPGDFLDVPKLLDKLKITL